MRLQVAASDQSREALQSGASVAINGTCLTLVNETDVGLAFDVVRQTLETTTLGSLRPGDRVNLERSLRLSDEIGGHQLSGHISGLVEVLDLQRDAHDCVMRLGAGESLIHYLFAKGFVALDGVSLTVSDMDHQSGWFEVCLIPETLARTTLGQRRQGDPLNLEIDSQTLATVQTVARLLRDPHIRLGCRQAS